MLRVYRAVLLRGKGRRSPKFLSSLPTPAVRGSWHRLGDLSPEERAEVTDGAWRSATPVHLVADSGDGSDRQAAATSAAALTPSSADARWVEAPLAFASDEAAADYLREESEDEGKESRVPALGLARDFFTELAAMSDEEIDREGYGLQVPQPQSDEERRLEALEVHRRFFADYYAMQGLVVAASDASEAAAQAARYAFVDAMLRPSRALFQVNGEKVLSRLTTRDQLECDTSGVFRGTPDPLVYLVDLMPTQAPGERPRLPYTAETSLLAQREEEEAAARIDSAEELALLLRDDGDFAETVDDDSAQHAKQIADHSASVVAMEEKGGEVPHQEQPSPRPAPQPPSIGQLHWLQRLVAADVLSSVNVLSPMVSLLAVHLAATRPAADSSGPRVIFDPFGQGHTPTQRTTYYRDIAQRVDALADDIVVVVALPAPATRRVPRRRGTRVMTGGEGDEEEDGLWEAEPSAAIPFDEKAMNVLYLQPPPRPPHTQRTHPFSWPHCRQLLGRCNVVVCAPRTSEDGVRPRVTLGDHNGNGAGDEEAVPNRFLTVCAEVNDHYRMLKSQLRMSLRHASRSATGGGWVLYATQSMNPIENEAVLCAVLTELRGGEGIAKEGFTAHCVPLTSPEVTRCLPAEELSSLQGWLQCGSVGGGLHTWVALEGGPPDQEAAFHSSVLVAEVAAASWRSIPVTHGFDGCYLCLLRVRSCVDSLTSGSNGIAEAEVTDVQGKRLVLVAGGAGSPIQSLATRATSQVAAALTKPASTSASEGGAEHHDHRRQYGTVWRVVCAGLPAGEGRPPDQEHGTPAAPTSLSSAISGTTALVSWTKQQLPPPSMPALLPPPRLPLSALMLSELLLLSQGQQGGGLADGPLLRRLFQLSQRGRAAKDIAGEVEEKELSALFAAVQGLAHVAPSAEHTVLLVPFIPTYLIGPAAPDEQQPGELHEAVAAELSDLLVVARLRCEPWLVSSSSNGGAHRALRKRYPFRFTLKLASLSTRTAERPAHEAAVAELSVGVRDALLYVLRRVGCPVDRLGLTDRFLDAEAEERLEGRSEGHGIHSPGVDGGIRLDEDDYAVESVPWSSTDTSHELAPRERHRTEQRLRRLEKTMRSEGGLSPDGSAAVEDWTRTVPATYRRRWRG